MILFTTLLFAAHLSTDLWSSERSPEPPTVDIRPELTERFGGVYRIAFDERYPDMKEIDRLVLIATHRPGGLIAAWFATGPKWTRVFTFSHLTLNLPPPEEQPIVSSEGALVLNGLTEFASTGRHCMFALTLRARSLQGLWQDTHRREPIAFQGELIDSLDPINSPTPPSGNLAGDLLDDLSGQYQLQFTGPASLLEGVLILRAEAHQPIGATLALHSPQDYLEFQFGTYTEREGMPLLTLTSEINALNLDYNQWIILKTTQKDAHGRFIWFGFGLSTQTGRSIHFSMVKITEWTNDKTTPPWSRAML